MRRLFMGLPLLLCVAFGSVAAQQPAAPVNPKKALADARIAADAGRLQDALGQFEAVLASTARDAARYRSDALYGLAMIRLAPDPAVADPARARAALEELTRTDAKYPRRQEGVAFIAWIDQMTALNRRLEDQARAAALATDAAVAAEAARNKTRIDELSARLDAATAATTASAGVKAETDKLQKEVAALRAENRTIRDDLASTRAELAKKDAALRKIAGSIVSKPPK